MADTTTGNGSAGGTQTPPPGASGAAGGGQGAADWMTGLNDESKAFVQNKGFKSPVDILESYRNLEKLNGVPQERIIKLPEKMEGDEMRAIWERLGMPKEAKDYQLPVPEKMDPKSMEPLQQIFHEAGVTKQAALKLAEKFAELGNNQAKAAAEARDLAFKNAETNLKKEWGAAFDQNTNMAKEAARLLGVDAKAVDAISAALGHDSAMKLFHKLSSGIREADFIGGKPPGGIMTPEQAKTKIKNLMLDSDFARRLEGNEIGAREEWNRLHQMAFVGEISI